MASIGLPVILALTISRSVHFKLLVMHLFALLTQISGVLKYALPVTVENCTVSHRVMVAFNLLFDATLVIFLLAKVYVTNDTRKLTCWEKTIIWVSRAYCWLYLPIVSIQVSSTFPGDVSEEGTFCFNGFEGEREVLNRNVTGYTTHNASLVVQFVLLLVLFVRPLLLRMENTRTGGALYKKVVMRNLLCTGLICIAYIVTTVVMVAALYKESPKEKTPSEVADVAPIINQLLVCCLTEISLPLGFTSCFKACSSADCLQGTAGTSCERGQADDEVTGPTAGDSKHNSSNPRFASSLEMP